MKHWDGSNWTGSNWDANNFRGPNAAAPAGSMRASLSGSATVTATLDFAPLSQPVRPVLLRKPRSRPGLIKRRTAIPVRLTARLAGCGSVSAGGQLDWSQWIEEDEIDLLLAA